MSDHVSSLGDDEVSRREALKKGAIIGGAAIMIPVVTTLSMSNASAQTTSGNPTRPGNGLG